MADFLLGSQTPVGVPNPPVMPADMVDFITIIVNAINAAVAKGVWDTNRPIYTVATLPASGNVIGTRAFVSNGTVATGFGVAPTGSGAVLLPVYANTATTWLYG